ncbi:MAG: SGNH/GDSL hydrolase family protein [Pseudomonadota bacterium]|nr:SGNH/GDSL hydrolase family protein [Pseudomonadota bacterium]
MRQNNIALTLLAAAVLVACGGNGSSGGDQTLKTKFSAQVSFGDSLSDLGSYAVGNVKTLGGGRFGINGDVTSVNPALTGKNWTELMAAQIGVAPPCPAMTGLDGDASLGYSVPVVLHAGCYGYAQGGSRVTNPVGYKNKLLGGIYGALTVPVAAQIQNHLNVSGGKFSGTELVLVMAGANEVFVQLTLMSAAATAAGTAAFGNTLVGLLAAGASNPLSAAQAIGLALQTEAARPGHTDASVVGAAVGAAAVQPGNSAVAAPAVYGPMVATAQAAGAKAGADYVTATAPSLVAAMATAATELGTLVKAQIIGKGANYVVVNNLPDIGTTPFGKESDASTLALVNAMVKTFNDVLSAALASEAKVAYVDAFAASHDQATNPAPYGLTNVTTPACDLSPAKNALDSSLVCNGSNLIAGDVSHYAFADKVHPTPFVQLLLARYVSKYMVQKGWL